jgi:hypothetical protein
MTLDTLFTLCAILGGTILFCQFLLSLLGFGGHDSDGGDADHDGSHGSEGHHEVAHDSQVAWFISVLSFRSLVAALTFFGLGGLAASAGGERPGWISLPVALAAGAFAMILVGAIMKALTRLKADGTVRYDRTIGATGTVYLTIPGQKTGSGKVTLSVQNRTVECQAITAQDSLPTGAKIVVVSVVSPGTVEVAPLPEAA